jgi:flotillin
MNVAQYKASVAQQQAQADLAYDLQKFKTQQLVEKEEVQVEVVQRDMQIQVQEKEIQRKERELDATIHKPADAEKYRMATVAEGERLRLETEAAGRASAAKQMGEGEAAATKARGLAEADVIRAQGLSQAEVIRQKGFAEAEAMMKKADAWQNYNQAAITEKVIEVLPQVAGAVAQPLAKTERIVMVNTGGDGGGLGASRITGEVASIISQLPPVVEALSGVDFQELLSKLPEIGKQVAKQPVKGSGPAEPAPEAKPT